MSLAFDFVTTLAVRFVDALVVGVGIAFIAAVLWTIVIGPTRAAELFVWWRDRRRRRRLEHPEVRARRVIAAGYAEIERQRGRAL